MVVTTEITRILFPRRFPASIWRWEAPRLFVYRSLQSPFLRCPGRKNEVPFLGASSRHLVSCSRHPRRGPCWQAYFPPFSLLCACGTITNWWASFLFGAWDALYIWLYEICWEMEGHIGRWRSTRLIFALLIWRGRWRVRWCVGFWSDKRERGVALQN